MLRHRSSPEVLKFWSADYRQIFKLGDEAMNKSMQGLFARLLIWVLVAAVSLPGSFAYAAVESEGTQAAVLTGKPDRPGKPGTSGKPGKPDRPGKPHAAAMIVKNGSPNADIFIAADAGELELLAAQELQQTIRAVSGAELPILRGDLSRQVSIELREKELKATRSGSVDVQIDIVNNGRRPIRVEFATAEGSDLPLQQAAGVTVKQREAASVTGSVYLPASLAEGKYLALIEPTVDGVPADPLALSIELDRNMLFNPGFELPVSEGWYGPPGVAYQDDQVKHGGAYAMRMNVGTVRTNQTLRLEPNQDYMLRAWIKGSSPGKVTVEIREMKSPFVTQHTYTRTFPVSEAWTLLEMPYTQEERDYDYNWIVFRHQSVGSPGTLWIDDVSLTKMEAAALAGQQGNGHAAYPEGRGKGRRANERLRIVLGTDKQIGSLAEDYPNDVAYLQQSDGFAIRQNGNTIYIFGTEPKGVLNGAYDFLEENAGVLWTRSTDVGTLYEPMADIAAAKVNYREKSPLPIRGWLTLGVNSSGEGGDFGTERLSARNKGNAIFAMVSGRRLWDRYRDSGLEPVMLGHNLGFWLPNELYFEEHPEYYNEVDGVPVPVSDSTQINFYHPDVPIIIGERAKSLIAATSLKYVGIGINDNSNFNQGELNRQPFTTEDGVVVQPDDPAYRSTVFFSFLNKVARVVKETYPDVKIVSYAYAFTDTPPKVELDDNIVIVYAPLYEDARTPLDTDNPGNPNYAYNEKLKGWAEKTKNIIVYNYYGSFPSEAYERPIAAKVQADMQYYRDLGILGVLPEGKIDAGDPGWGVNALQYWLFNQLFWNPDADIEALKAEFIRKAYGAAAEAMTRYYDLIEQGWNYDQAQQSWATSGETLVRQYIVRAGIKDEAQAALNEAYALADEQARARIEPIKRTFERMVELVGDGEELSANAKRTTASKEQILAPLDFQSGPWAEAEPISNFLDMTTKELPRVETRAYLLWDDEYLYVGYENFDNDISQIIVSETAPNEWWLSGKDDSVETYLTGDLTGSGPYYAFMTNPIALNLDYQGPAIDPSFEADWASNAEIRFDRWNVVQAIPFASIGVNPQETTTLKGLLFRNFHRTGYGLGLYGWGGGAVWNPADFNEIRLVP